MPVSGVGRFRHDERRDDGDVRLAEVDVRRESTQTLIDPDVDGGLVIGSGGEGRVVSAVMTMLRGMDLRTTPPVVLIPGVRGQP